MSSNDSLLEIEVNRGVINSTLEHGRENWRNSYPITSLLNDKSPRVTVVNLAASEAALAAKLSPATPPKLRDSGSRNREQVTRSEVVSSQVCYSCGTTDIFSAKCSQLDTAADKPAVAVSCSDDSAAVSAVGLSWRRLRISRAKLRATSTASELLFCFAMIGLVELQINKPTNVPEGLFILFSVNTSVLVVLHILALMISTIILPSIDTVTSLHPRALVDESPHLRMRHFIDLAWGCSTVLGMVLFLFEVLLFAWFKFWDYSFSAALSATVLMVLFIAIFVTFALYFYHTILAFNAAEPPAKHTDHIEDRDG